MAVTVQRALDMTVKRIAELEEELDAIRAYRDVLESTKKNPQIGPDFVISPLPGCSD